MKKTLFILILFFYFTINHLYSQNGGIVEVKSIQTSSLVFNDTIKYKSKSTKKLSDNSIAVNKIAELNATDYSAVSKKKLHYRINKSIFQKRKKTIKRKKIPKPY